MTKVALFAAHKAELNGKMAEKVQLLKSAKSHLETARDLFSAGNDKAKEANAYAENGAFALFRAECTGLTSKEETSAILGDTFGFKKKKDGSNSATPDGQGEAIRKRVVRAIQVDNYVNKNGEQPAFLAGVDKEAAGQVLLEMTEPAEGTNGLSIFTAYDRWAKLKDKPATVEMAFDPVKVAKMVTALKSDGSMDKIANSQALIAAYSELIDVLDSFTVEVPAKEAAKIKAVA